MSRLVLHWAIAKQECAITSLTFHPTLPHRVTLLNSDNSLALMDVDSRQLNKWSQDNAHLLPAALAQVKGACVD